MVEVTKGSAHTTAVAAPVGVVSMAPTTPSPTLVGGGGGSIKHSNSHSSIVSSEHDSGLGGHVSPVSVGRSFSFISLFHISCES